MLELFEQIQEWTEKKKPFAIATVIKTWGSSPRPIGSSMVINEAQEMAGSVSGGCVEGSVIKKAIEILSTDESVRLAFGITDEDAWSVGLSCGGKMQVLLEPFLAFSENGVEKAVWSNLKECLHSNTSCVLATRIGGIGSRHFILLPNSDKFIGDAVPALKHKMASAYQSRKNEVIEIEDQAYFIQVFPRKSQLLIVGAAHITTHLVTLGKLYDFETIVIDPRGIFADKTQFPTTPDHLHNEWPAEIIPNYILDQYTYAVLLTHDPKIDDQALHLLLQSEVGYIGALGSTRTHDKRKARLEKAGFSTSDIAKIHGPIGLNIHAKRPKEIALSIMGEIIQIQNASK